MPGGGFLCTFDLYVVRLNMKFDKTTEYIDIGTLYMQMRLKKILQVVWYIQKLWFI